VCACMCVCVCVCVHVCVCGRATITSMLDCTQASSVRSAQPLTRLLPSEKTCTPAGGPPSRACWTALRRPACGPRNHSRGSSLRKKPAHPQAGRHHERAGLHSGVQRAVRATTHAAPPFGKNVHTRRRAAIASVLDCTEVSSVQTALSELAEAQVGPLEAGLFLCGLLCVAAAAAPAAVHAVCLSARGLLLQQQGAALSWASSLAPARLSHSLCACIMPCSPFLIPWRRTRLLPLPTSAPFPTPLPSPPPPRAAGAAGGHHAAACHPVPRAGEHFRGPPERGCPRALPQRRHPHVHGCVRHPVCCPRPLRLLNVQTVRLPTDQTVRLSTAQTVRLLTVQTVRLSTCRSWVRRPHFMGVPCHASYSSCKYARVCVCVCVCMLVCVQGHGLMDTYAT